MAQEQDEDLVQALDSKNPPSMPGSGRFISWVKDLVLKKKKDKEILSTKELTPDFDTIISGVSRYHKVRPTKLKAVRRGIENEPSDVVIYTAAIQVPLWSRVQYILHRLRPQESTRASSQVRGVYPQST